MISLSFDSLRSSIGLTLSFDSLRSSILDSANLVHHMDSAMRLVIEDDVGDAEQGACAHQMVQPWMDDPEDEGRGRQGDTSARKVHPMDQQGINTV